MHADRGFGVVPALRSGFDHFHAHVLYYDCITSACTHSLTPLSYPDRNQMYTRSILIWLYTTHVYAYTFT